VDDYAFIDAGDGLRLERFGEHVVARPHPAATQARRGPGRWTEADLRFDRDPGWSGDGLQAARDGWVVSVAGVALELRPTEAGHVGLFPEHASLLPWLRSRVAVRAEAGRAEPPPTVLNLFAYTGLATMALASGGANVAHVDAARPSVAWARRNAAIGGLADRPIRWLVDDVRGFVAREVRRGRRYDGVVLDPPTYGHGAAGKAWRLAADLPRLLDDVRRLLAPGGFILLTAHTEALDPDDLGSYLAEIVDGVETGDLRLTAESGAVLDLGAFARSSGAS
jgi:23S rRNA (cytosine1962-C5)-methyltransferase